MPRKKALVPKNRNELPATKRKKVVVKKEPKSKVEKPYNCNTMTSAAFMGMLKSALRARSRYWKPIAKVKLAARRDYAGPNKRQRFEYKCNLCNLYFKSEDVQVDHIQPVGSLTCLQDLPLVVERLFCSEENLQVLCSKCHAAKSIIDIANIKEEKKNRSK